MDIAGRCLTDYMQKLMLEIGENFNSSAEKEIVKSIKEDCCYVAQNWEEESEACKNNSEHDKNYTLPDKRVLTIPARLRMQCPELLFKP